MARHDTITVTLEEPLDEEYVERLCRAIEMHDGVAAADPGEVDNAAMLAARHQLRGEALDAVRGVFD